MCWPHIELQIFLWICLDKISWVEWHQLIQCGQVCWVRTSQHQELPRWSGVDQLGVILFLWEVLFWSQRTLVTNKLRQLVPMWVKYFDLMVFGLLEFSKRLNFIYTFVYVYWVFIILKVVSWNFVNWLGVFALWAAEINDFCVIIWFPVLNISYHLLVLKVKLWNYLGD